MDLMKLLATLTLDKDEYDKGIKEAEKEANDIKIDQPKIPKPDNEEFKKGVEESQTVGETFKTVMTGVWEGLKSAIVVTGITSAVMGVVGAMRQGINMAIENGDAVGKGAANLKLSTKAYQEYSYALGKSNLQMKDLNTAMTNIDKVKAGKGTKDQAAYLEKLNLNAEDAAFGIEQLMSAIADYGGDDKGAIIDAFFGKSEKWTGYFEQTSSEIEKLKREAEDMGLIMSDEAVQNAVEFKDATEELNNRLDSIKRSFGESLLPMLKDAAQTMAKIVAFFMGGSDNSLSAMFADDDKEMSKQLLTIEGTSSAAMEMVDKLFKLGEAEKMTAEQEEEWKATADWLIKNIPELSKQIDADTLSINGNKTAIEEEIKKWKELATQRAVAEAKEKKQKQMMDENSEAIDKQAKARAKSDEAMQKHYERVAEANKLLKDNEGLSNIFSSVFGTTELTGREENIGKMLDWLSEVGYEFANTKTFQDLTEEYNKLMNEQRTLQDEAEKFSEQLKKAQDEYDAWCKAVDELYGTTSENAAAATSDINGVGEAVKGLPDGKTIDINVNTHQNFTGTQKAIGDAYIPYDNYPALLHRGEKVLTATQVRRGEGGGGADLSHLEDRIAAAIRAGMDGVTVNSYLNGKSVTEEVNRNNMRDVKGRRFAR